MDQILTINKLYYKNIQILNNNSNCEETKHFLSIIDVPVIHNLQNITPRINTFDNKHIYDMLPDKFIITDPDLKLNKDIPTNFIEILSDLSDNYKTSKIGFALDISEPEKIYQDNNYFMKLSICNWEKQFWYNKINNDNYELYYAIKFIHQMIHLINFIQ